MMEKIKRYFIRLLLALVGVSYDTVEVHVAVGKTSGQEEFDRKVEEGVKSMWNSRTVRIYDAEGNGLELAVAIKTKFIQQVLNRWNERVEIERIGSTIDVRVKPDDA